MKSYKTLEGISDGRLYDSEDWVAADAGGCKGCSACCHHVGDLVILTPFDVWGLRNYLKVSLEELLENNLELCEENKIFLPHLRMQGPSQRCSFLDEENRCKVHAHRPNICRLFPLGRVYEGNTFKYFLQAGNCQKTPLKDVKVKDWIAIEDYEQNKAFILAWHQLLKALAFRLKFVREVEECKGINEYLLDTFYHKLLEEPKDFYTAFWSKLPEAKSYLGIL